MMAESRTPSARSLLFGSLRPHRTVLLLAGLLMMGESLFSLVIPWLAGRFARLLVDPESSAALSLETLLGVWALLFVLLALARFASSFLVTRSGARLLADLSNRLYDHLQVLPVSYLQRRRRGDFLALLSNDVAVIAHFLTGTLAGLLPQLLVLVGAFVMMARIDLTVAVLVAAMVPLFFLLLKVLGRRIRPVSSALMQQQADTLALAEENLGLLPLIKAFNREAIESERFRRETAKVLRLRQRQLGLQAMLSPVLQLTASLGVLLVLWLSGRLLVAGRLDLPEMVSLLLYGLFFTRPVSGLANLYGQLQQVRGASERLGQIFAVAPEPDHEGAAELPPVKGEIGFHDLHFHYPGGRELFHGLDLAVAAGETVAITGANGAGKSTLLHLLMRFVDPCEGTITIDGVDIRTVSLASLRRQVGLVSQQVLLLDGTVADNIRYGHPLAGDEAVERAARAAHAHDFITALPRGYDTFVGEDGVRLSGGQRQRIALARALLTDPPILLLDEATSMLDAEGERHFVQECSELFSRRTVLLITHRPATLALADRVVELGKGS